MSNSTPVFVAGGLDPGTAYTLHVAVLSPMGTSSPVKLHAFTVRTAEKRMQGTSFIGGYERVEYGMGGCRGEMR